MDCGCGILRQTALRWVSNGLCVLLIGASATFARSETIKEMNYQHIDPDGSIVSEGLRINDVGLLRVDDFGGGRVRSMALAQNSDQRVFQFEVTFDVDVCAFGGRVSLDPRAERHAIKVTFDFTDVEHRQVGRQTRFPAGGTTRQAFESVGFDNQFRRVVIRVEGGSHAGLARLRARPCNLLLS